MIQGSATARPAATRLPFEACSDPEAREAMDSIQETRGIGRFVLMGLCSGAVTAFEAAGVDPRVAGAVLINPQGFNLNPEWNGYVVNRGDARSTGRGRCSAPRAGGKRSPACGLQSGWSPCSGASAGSGGARGRVSVVTPRGAVLEKLVGREVRALLVCSEGDDGIEYMNVILRQDVRT